MNRKEILQAINYNGEYTKETKKSLKALLKKYHPDHYKKESDTFKLVNQIKKELESGKKIDVVESKPKEKFDEDFIGIYNEIDELTKKKDDLLEKKAKYQKELDSLYKKYQIEYNKTIDNRNIDVDINNEILELEKKKQIYNILLIISVVATLILIFTKFYYPIIITLILFGYVIYNFFNIEVKIEKELENNNKNNSLMDTNIKNITGINNEITKLNRKIWELDCEIRKIYTKINLLHAKIR